MEETPHCCTSAGIKSDLICAIIVETTSAPVTIIGVYLPTTDSPSDVYDDYLSNIEALIKQHSYVPVIIAGDFNAHVGPDSSPRQQSQARCNDKQNSHSKLLW